MKQQFAVTREELSGLQWVVQCNQNVNFARGWESIAAFNCLPVADQYADECKETNPHMLYRVLELSTIQPTHAIVYETD